MDGFLGASDGRWQARCMDAAGGGQVVRGEVLHTVADIHAVFTLAGVLLTVGVVVGGRLMAPVLRRRLAGIQPRELTALEGTALARWDRRDRMLFGVTMTAIVGFSLGSGLPFLPAGAIALGYVAMLATAIACLAHHFGVRCPVCRWPLGVQSSLGLPAVCEVCEATLRPELAPLRALLARTPTRYASTTTFLGIPLLAIATGADAAGSERRGVAVGWLALGDVALGGIAVGQTACGVVAVGGVAVGGLAVGGIAVAGMAIGGLAVGAAACGGVAIGWLAVGGLALGRTALGAVTAPF